MNVQFIKNKSSSLICRNHHRIISSSSLCCFLLAGWTECPKHVCVCVCVTSSCCQVCVRLCILTWKLVGSGAPLLFRAAARPSRADLLPSIIFSSAWLLCTRRTEETRHTWTGQKSLRGHTGSVSSRTTGGFSFISCFKPFSSCVLIPLWKMELWCLAAEHRPTQIKVTDVCEDPPADVHRVSDPVLFGPPAQASA